MIMNSYPELYSNLNSINERYARNLKDLIITTRDGLLRSALRGYIQNLNLGSIRQD